jgi:hypothetical protein
MRSLAIVVALCFLVSPLVAQTNPPANPPAQAPPSEEQPQSDSNPIQVVFFSVRNEYFNLRGDAWTNASILRLDRVLIRKPKWVGGKVGILSRLDIPITTAHAAGETHAGLGDIYGQVIHVPWLTRRFALGLGSGLTFPAATHRSLGRGKWIASPLAVPIWFLPQRKGLFLVKLQQQVSFAGNSSRPDVNALLTTPTVLYRFQRRWWVLLDTEVKTNWELNNRSSFRTGLELGYVVNRRLALIVKTEVPWGPNREADWVLKVTLTRYRAQ